jgi:lipid-binding SYLF domain-containing protein
MNRTARTPSRRGRTIAQLTVLLVAAAPIGVAQAEPDTNIQKPGHRTSVSVAGGLGAGADFEISRPLGAS